MENNKVEIIFKIILNDLVLNEKSMLAHGLSKNDIDELISHKIIISKDGDKYILGDINKLRRYGIKLLYEKNAKVANRCFRKCYEIAPRDKRVCLQVFLAAIKRKDYEEAIAIFENLESISSPKDYPDNNLYLYLLNIITESVGKYQEKVRNIEYDDLILIDKPNNRGENEIRHSILRNKLLHAYQKLNVIINRQSDYSVKLEVIRELLIQSINTEKEFKANIFEMIQKEQYNLIISALIKKRQNRYLSDIETYILLITQAIVDMQNTQTIPIKKENNAKNIYEALLAQDFEAAKKINDEFLEYRNELKENDAIYILLTKVIELQEEIKFNKQNSGYTRKRTI